MSDINTLIKQGTGGVDVNVGLSDWAETNGGSGNDINQRLMSLLESLGYTEGALNDRLFAFLRDEGYTGGLNKMWYDFWLAGGTIGGVTWDPSALFASGEEGAWYSPELSVTTYGYIAAAGTNGGYIVPGTVDSTVGVIFDLSLGMAEDATKQSISTDITGWTNNGYDTFVDNGSSVTVLKTTAGGTDTAYSNQVAALDLVAGEVYRITYTISGYSGTGTGRVQLGLSTNQRTTKSRGITANGTYTDYIWAIITQANVSVQLVTTDTDFGCTLSDISIAQVPGNHAYQTTNASRPVLRARYNWMRDSEVFTPASTQWSQAGANTITDNAVVAPDGETTGATIAFVAGGRIYQQIGDVPVVGLYTASIYFKKNGSNDYVSLSFSTGTSYADAIGTVFNLNTGAIVSDNSAGASFSGLTSSITSVGNGWYRCTITGTSASVGNLYFLISSRTDTTWTTSEAGCDLALWGAQLNIGSTLSPYQRISDPPDYDTTSSMEAWDFPCYLEFDGVDDFLVVPSTSYGAGETVALFAGVTVDQDAVNARMFDHGDDVLAMMPTTGTPDYYTFNVSTANGDGSAATASVGTTPETFVYSGYGTSNGTNYIRKNGSAGTSGTAGTGTAMAATTSNIGRRLSGATAYFDGSIYELVLRVNDTEPSAEELASVESYMATKAGVTL